MTLLQKISAGTVAGLALWGIILWRDSRADAASAKLVEATTKLEKIQHDNAEFTKKAQEQIAAFQDQNERLAADNRRLAGQLADSNRRMVALQQDLATRLNTLQTAPIAEVVTRWGVLADVPLTQFRTGQDAVSVTFDGARRTTIALERGATAQKEIGELEGQVGNLGQQIKNRDGTIANKDAELTIERERVQHISQELSATDAKGKAEVADVKAKARKSKLRWAGVFLAIGITLGYIAH